MKYSARTPVTIISFLFLLMLTGMSKIVLSGPVFSVAQYYTYTITLVNWRRLMQQRDLSILSGIWASQ